MRVVCCIMATISQLTAFGLWKHVDSMYHPYGIYFDTILTSVATVAMEVRHTHA